MDFLLKQRLVGAIVLVALGVIFIPMLLEGPDKQLVPDMQPMPEPAERRVSEPLDSFPAPGGIPDHPMQSIVQADAPAGESEPAPVIRPGEVPLALPQAPNAAKAQPEPKPVPTPAEPEPAAPVAKAADTPSAKPADPGPLGNWVVQVGSFSAEGNALRLRDKLRAGGFATQVEKVIITGKAHYRVRVGPYLQRADADRDQKKLAATFDLKGRVLSYP